MASLATTLIPWPVLLVLNTALGCASRSDTRVGPEPASAAEATASAPPQPELPQAAPQPAESPAVHCPGANAEPPRGLEAPVSAPADAKCRSFPRKLTRRIEKAARKEWTLSMPRSKLDVSFACDGFGDDLGELIFERSSGHGFSLGLYRIRPHDAGSYEVTWLGYGAYGTRARFDDPEHPPTPWDLAARSGAKVHTAIIPADRIEPMLLELRALMHLRLREVEPPPSDSGTHSVQVSGSSNDFHTAYRFVDAKGLGRQDFWAGYQGSDEQEQWVPLSLAERVFVDLIHANDLAPLFVERVPTDADRDFFVERFATARERGDEYGFWYVRERLLGMARTLGDARLVPDLLEMLTLPAGPSKDRSRAVAVDLLAGLVGHDVRYGDDGSVRSVGDASEALRSVCSKP